MSATLIFWAAIICGQQADGPAANRRVADAPNDAGCGFGRTNAFGPGGWYSHQTVETRFGPLRRRSTRTVFDRYYPGFCGGPFAPGGFVGGYSPLGFIASPYGSVPVIVSGYDGFGPQYVGSAYIGPPVIVVPPPIVVVAPPVQPIDPRVPVAAPAVLPRNATTDIPLELVDQLIQRRRPTLAQRAQSAKLEGGGDRLFRAGHFDRAAERYQQSLVQTPDNDDLSFKRGAALAAVGQYDEAGRVLRDALRQRPDWPFVPHDLHQLFPDAAAIRRTLDALERESRKPHADADVQFLRGYMLYFSGERDAAAAIFRNPPAGGPTRHFQVFADAIDRDR